jgi:hypothetical protein
VSLHVEDLAEFRAFIGRFRAGLDELNGECSRMELYALEVCAWMDRCGDEATEEVSAAEGDVAKYEEALAACEAEEDENYVPDCSSEWSALCDAREHLKEAQHRLRQAQNPRLGLNEQRAILLKRIRAGRNEFSEAESRGVRYLGDQCQQMEAILRLSSPGI